jgi:hypothetical protein
MCVLHQSTPFYSSYFLVETLRSQLLVVIIINNFKAWANWSVQRQLSSQLVMFSPF